MEKIEFIAEAKRRGYSDKTIQEIVDFNEKCVRMGYPLKYSFDGALSDDEIDCTYAEQVNFSQLA